MRIIAELPYYTEGPVTDSMGNIYFTTLSGGTILKTTPGGEMIEWARSACPNGQVILHNADHLICDSKLSAIRRFSPDGNHIRDEIRFTCAGTPVLVPNDLCTDKEEGFYFTDSIRHSGKVFYSGAHGMQSVVASHLDYPNGLALTDDQSVLYVAESYKNRILKINLQQPGLADHAPEVLINLPRHPSGTMNNNLPDGLTLDHLGNIWVAHYGMHAVHKITPEGRLLLSLKTSLPLTSNLIFPRPGLLLVTGGEGEPGPGALIEFEL